MSAKKKDRQDERTPPEQPPRAAEPDDAPAETPADPPADAQALRAERDDLLGRLQRVSADYVNFQKRIQREHEQSRQYANEGVIKALLPIVDDMERALEAARANHPADDPLLVGMQLVHDKLMAMLGGFGLSTIEAEGRPFDPDLHAAMMQEPTDAVPPRTVLKEVQKGYQLKGRTLRPSGVVVSREPDQPDEEGGVDANV